MAVDDTRVKTLAIYCLDLDRHSMASPGIFNYARRLVQALARETEPGFHIRLWVSSANRQDLVPDLLPTWISVRTIPGRFCGGVRRLWADHVLAAWLPLLDGVDAVHHPKGWLPACMPGRARHLATLHDTIVHYLDAHYPHYRSAARSRYFVRASLHSIRHADTILTDSQASARALRELAGSRDVPIVVADLGPGIDGMPGSPAAKADRLLVIGSHIPYKATAETLRLLGEYAARRGARLPVTVTTLDRWPADWSPLPVGLDVRFTGRLDDAALVREMGASRTLVFLSEIEGFGMPALEAYACGTPVCYRLHTAVAEMLDGIPGGWDGRGSDAFAAALDTALAMPAAQVAAHSKRLLAKYNWTNCAKQTLAVYRQILGMEA